jgi:ABC-type dipeptide/oligopeptide/nickel transport system permease subunit
LGLGVQPPTPSLGRMINEGKDFILSSPNLFILPSLILAMIIIFFNSLGEKLRETLEVKK